MALVDFDKLAKEYASLEDFGITAVSEDDYNQKVANKANQITEPLENQVKDLYERLDKIEKIVVPFLTKLHSTGDKEYIYWPNRKPIIEEQIAKILKLTRE